MSDYYFDENIFRSNFNAKEPDEKEENSYRLNHCSNKCFKLYPYKAATKKASPIVYDLEDVVSCFFRKVLNISTETITFDDLCKKIQTKIEFDEPEDIDVFREIIHSQFFKGDNFNANNIGLYAYKTIIDNKSPSEIADFLYSVLGIDADEKENIKKAENEYPFNVLERLVIDSIENSEENDNTNEKIYYKVKRSIQQKFKKDFEFMLSSGMTAIDDFSNLLDFYYFYYVSQCTLTLDLFGNGDHNKLEKIYFALDWEKISKNRLCCIEGWNKLSDNVTRMFSHAVTLEILNQNNLPMMDYIDFKELVYNNEELDKRVSEEVKKAESIYVSYIGDYKKFDTIGECSGINYTDSAIRHLFECINMQFNETDRNRASKFYSEKFSAFCKKRFIKSRGRLGAVFNLTEGDIIFLTKLALGNSEKIRLNDLYKQYEYRGVYLDITSKTMVQEFFEKLNLIDKKSDSGDAQYVKRIL